MIGPGKYDHLCTYVRHEAKAAGAIVIVFEGEQGPGFACQLDALNMLTIPSVLRQIADQIEASFAGAPS
jgi:hypothetical protein